MPQYRKKYSTSKDYLSLLVYLYLLVYASYQWQQVPRTLHTNDNSNQRHFTLISSYTKDTSKQWNNKYKGYFISTTTHTRDTSYQRHLIPRILHINDNSYQGHFISTTAHTKDTSYNDNSYQGHFISTTAHTKDTSYQRHLKPRTLHIIE